MNNAAEAVPESFGVISADSMIERAAMAAYIAFTVRPGHDRTRDDAIWEWQQDSLAISPSKADFLRCARAAIKEMREPTPHMARVAYGLYPQDDGDHDVVECWREMIDTALAEEG